MSRFNTGNPIGSADVKDLSDNAKNLDIAVNDTLKLKWDDRFGVERKTLHGIEVAANATLDDISERADTVLSSLGFLAPVAYASGLDVSTPNFTVLKDGTIYAANAAYVPFTSGEWDESKWYPIQNQFNNHALLVFSTRAQSASAVVLSPDDQRYEIEKDELYGGRRTLNKVASGALVFVEFADAVQDASGGLVDAPGWPAVPKVNSGSTVADSVLNAQAQSLANRTASIKEKIDNLGKVEAISVADKTIHSTDSHKYLRFEASGLKTALFSLSSNLKGGEEFEIANRADAGYLLLSGSGVSINPFRGGTLALGSGDSVKMRAVSASVVDILYGSTSTFRPQLPLIANENSTFNDEGDSTAGWSATGASLSTSASYMRATKTGAVGATCSITKPWTFTPAGRDFILYGKVRASAVSQFDATTFYIMSGGKEIAFWLGSNGASNGYAVGSSGIIGYEGATRKNATVASSGLSYSTTAVEFAIQYDSKFGQINCWFREADGRWKLKARLKCDFVSNTSFSIAKHSDAPNGAWFEFDYLTLCQPNIIAIGDSHCAGAVLFDPNIALALGDDESTWMRHAKIYPNLRNNLIVNKGVGAQTSAQITARINEVTRENPRTVFLHASSNDMPATVTPSVRSSNIQSAVNSIKSAGQNVVLLNALYATSAYSGNPGYRDYMRSWWESDRESLTQVDQSLDIMSPVINESGFLATANAQADNVHLTPTAYALVGGYITPT